MNRILYISLTGMTEALGKSQVIAYLKPLATTNKIFLISFEREHRRENKEILMADLLKNGIIWLPLQYSNKFGVFSTLFQIIQCILFGIIISWKNKINVVHARSMIPAVMGFIICKLSRAKLLFDIRDFSTDEKVDRGRIKNNSLIYKILLSIENALYVNSDFIVALTSVSKDILHRKFNIKESKIEVIPTCADSGVFFPLSESEKNKIRKQYMFAENDYICIHVGTVTGWYLFDEELAFYKQIKICKPNAKFLILNQGQHDYINNKLNEYDLNKDDITLLEVEFEDVNRLINIADIALYFIIPSYSKKAAAPTKFAEFVRVNLPSITNSGVGDMDYYVREFNVGVIVDPYVVNKKIIESVLLVLDDVKANARYEELYKTAFSIEVATDKYLKIYDELSNE